MFDARFAQRKSPSCTQWEEFEGSIDALGFLRMLKDALPDTKSIIRALSLNIGVLSATVLPIISFSVGSGQLTEHCLNVVCFEFNDEIRFSSPISYLVEI